MDNIPKVVAVIFRNEETNTVAEFALPPEGGIVMIPDGAYEFTAYNIGQYGNIFKETNAGRIATTPVSHKLKGKYYETPDFLCLENQKVVLTDFENTRLITAKPIRRTARVDYRINGIERLEKQMLSMLYCRDVQPNWNSIPDVVWKGMKMEYSII